MATEEPLLGCVGFEWGEGNATKNWKRHRVPRSECEELFFLAPLVTVQDAKHSGLERRFLALGRTVGGRRLFVALTVRRDRIRVISARPMSRRERGAYERAKQAGEAEPSP
ncbi:MAG: BrnT family toxin [bacterium]